jgi:DNA-binding response OmpR family regulator
MFDLVRKLKPKEADAEKPLSRAASPRDGTRIRLLAITQDAETWQALSRIADEFGWMLLWAHTAEAAVATLSHYPVQIVILDRDLPGGDWKAALSRIGSLEPGVCVLLASAVSDEYLWKEVVQRQGFDVVTKPFEADRVVRLVNLASSWRGWMHGPVRR